MTASLTCSSAVCALLSLIRAGFNVDALATYCSLLDLVEGKETLVLVCLDVKESFLCTHSPTKVGFLVNNGTKTFGYHISIIESTDYDTIRDKVFSKCLLYVSILLS